MTGLEEKDILATRRKEIKEIQKTFEDVEIIDSYITNGTRYYIESIFNDTKCWDIYWLGRSLESLAKADVLWLVDGWEQSKGCKIELECAIKYDMDISYPPERKNNGE